MQEKNNNNPTGPVSVDFYEIRKTADSVTSLIAVILCAGGLKGSNTWDISYSESLLIQFTPAHTLVCHTTNTISTLDAVSHRNLNDPFHCTLSHLHQTLSLPTVYIVSCLLMWQVTNVEQSPFHAPSSVFLFLIYFRFSSCCTYIYIHCVYIYTNSI